MFLPFDPFVAFAYAALVLLLMFLYRLAKTSLARLMVYFLSLALVLLFLLLFAPR